MTNNAMVQGVLSPRVVNRRRVVVLLAGLAVLGFAAGPAAAQPTSMGSSAWKTAASYPLPITYAQAAGEGGKVYSFGGFDRDGAARGESYTYDGQRDTWTAIAPMPTARGAGVAVAASTGVIFVIGGTPTAVGEFNVNEAYNPRTNTWTTRAAMPTARYNMGATLGRDGRIYVVGGWDSNGARFDKVEAYNPRTDTWTTVAPLPDSIVASTVATGNDGRVYSIGGDNGGSSPIDTTYAYDIQSSTWTTAAPLPYTDVNAAAAVGKDGRIYVIDGKTTYTPPPGQSGKINAVSVFDARRNTWTTAPSDVVRRCAFSAASDGVGHIVAIGGQGVGSPIPVLDTVSRLAT